jgi:fluoroacetyl-CoA thioesterase
MEIDLLLGLKGKIQKTVAHEDTAIHVRSGHVDALATPVMIGLMEEAAVAALDQRLPQGQHTVGIHVDVRHSAPTPVGMIVTAHAELIAREGRTLTFRVTAVDEKETVGEGTHQRAIIDLARFHQRVEAKGAAQRP